ncbi:aminoacyl-tRNA deacylase [Aneurinibacillus thermoaerophilus]|uniref:YbaK/EbsC family protein n=1 Tax=Aneurinibacillus thermoaerophilus TaxID=143495 RepID=A0ABX8YEE7_ANETH|nr:YbaK/EbsC family protein [Aneurinibacillus thermoaerophilus]MED0677150.1 YbaK/EbsC family protein [Aneurinibacillus thermoaerophilus]MED0680537.1 YbaK/EbsC family protein [Aneurinibacillus thermoaerophilus]MED0736236.1 YbaK/EbsC family protein [Aneurinibacillus thermoaerophilus]MED0758567.1 YbaK/EbsC family protein [Aneurinibacillus thermoaerophilus]MED0760461.1 YbaK/EbsC family protein [Aneurinibacillus thermoaerophilus]
MEHLKTILQENGVQFEIIHHENPIHTAQEGADYFRIEIGQTAPTLVLKSEKGYFAMIISGDRGHVNLEKVSEILECNQLKLAHPKEVQQITGYTVGSLPLVGLSLPCIVDSKLFRYPFIYGGTGEPHSTLKISPNALEKLNQVIAFIE